MKLKRMDSAIYQKLRYVNELKIMSVAIIANTKQICKIVRYICLLYYFQKILMMIPANVRKVVLQLKTQSTDIKKINAMKKRGESTKEESIELEAIEGKPDCGHVRIQHVRFQNIEKYIQIHTHHNNNMLFHSLLIGYRRRNYCCK